jgi:hypothetical protein
MDVCSNTAKDLSIWLNRGLSPIVFFSIWLNRGLSPIVFWSSL